MFGVKGVAKALKEVVEMGGRITEESAEFLDNLLGDKLDDLQGDAREFVEAAEKAAKSKLAEIEERLDNILERLDEIEDDLPAKKTQPAVKKASTMK